jgi:orotate phosphoribosyltransferase
VRGVVVAVDRQEKGQGALTAVEELAQEFGVPVVATITISEAADQLVADGRLAREERERIRAYLGR